MIKKAMLVFLVLFGTISYSKVLLVKGDYVNFDNKPYTKLWEIKIEDNKILFLDKEKVKAVLFLNNGEVEKIIEYKKVAGKTKKFVIEKPSQIKLELKANYFPFEFAINYLKGKSVKNTDKFTLIEAREK